MGTDGWRRGAAVAAADLERRGVRGTRGVFYIFTIITNGTHQIIIYRMAPTTIPVERSLTYNFTTFAYVASHAAMQRWRPVSPKCKMSSLPPISSLSPSPTAGSQLYSHFQVGPTCQLHLLPLDTATATGPSTATAPSTGSVHETLALNPHPIPAVPSSPAMAKALLFSSSSLLPALPPRQRGRRGPAPTALAPLGPPARRGLRREGGAPRARLARGRGPPPPGRALHARRRRGRGRGRGAGGHGGAEERRVVQLHLRGSGCVER